MDILELGAIELGQKIAARKLGVAEATRLALEQIAKTNREYNAYITVDVDEALRQADEVQRQLDSGALVSPLAGVPMAVKDNISTGQLPTTCASKMLAGYQPPYSATVIERLQANGAVILGKTNLDEFAMGNTSGSSAVGAVKNPWSADRSPGGSSGGSAAAVAARTAWYALGSDTGGSIRQPSALCGLTGFKPTYGTVSRYGLIAYASSLDQIGPMARSAADCAVAMSLFAGHDSRDSTSLPSGSNLNLEELASAARESLDGGQLQIGLPENWLHSKLDPQIRQAVLKAAKVLEDLGARIIPLHIPLTDEAVPAYYLIAAAEASGNLARFDGIQYGARPEPGQTENLVDYYAIARSQGFGPEVKRRILLGTFALSAGYYDAWYLKALQVRQMIIDGYNGIFNSCDCILAPVTLSSAPLLDEKQNDPLSMYLEDIYTVGANLAGLPALALPCGFDDANLPIGMQLIGPPLSDARLLGLGCAYQRSTDFHMAKPGEVRS